MRNENPKKNETIKCSERLVWFALSLYSIRYRLRGVFAAPWKSADIENAVFFFFLEKPRESVVFCEGFKKQ